MLHKQSNTINRSKILLGSNKIFYVKKKISYFWKRLCAGEQL
jgi:hypothetical protein